MGSLKFCCGILISFLVVSCATPVRLPKDISSEKKLLLPFRIDTVLIVDLRIDTVSAALKLPVLAVRQCEWIVRPTLKSELQKELIKLIKTSSYAEGLPAKVTLSINDGYYKISGNATHVGEYTMFDCSITFDLTESHKQWRSSASAFHDCEGIFNATEKHAKEMYRITAINGVYTTLRKGETIFNSDSN